MRGMTTSQKNHRKSRDDRYESNESNAVPDMSNQDETVVDY